MCRRVDTATTATSVCRERRCRYTEEDVDFGFTYSGEIGNLVFNDANDNGVYDPTPGETGLPM